MGRLDDWHRRWRSDRWLQDRWRLRQLWVRWWLWKVDSARRQRCIEALRVLVRIGWWWLIRLLAWLLDRDSPGGRPPGTGDSRER